MTNTSLQRSQPLTSTCKERKNKWKFTFVFVPDMQLCHSRTLQQGSYSHQTLHWRTAVVHSVHLFIQKNAIHIMNSHYATDVSRYEAKKMLLSMLQKKICLTWSFRRCWTLTGSESESSAFSHPTGLQRDWKHDICIYQHHDAAFNTSQTASVMDTIYYITHLGVVHMGPSSINPNKTCYGSNRNEMSRCDVTHSSTDREGQCSSDLMSLWRSELLQSWFNKLERDKIKKKKKKKDGITC